MQTRDRPQSVATLVMRLTSFGALPVISAVNLLVALPILARSVEVREWAALAVGQSIGAVAALALSNGWNVLGPVRVAESTTPGARQELLRLSMASRLVTSCPILPLAVLVSLLVAPRGTGLLTATMTAAAALSGLGFAWFGIGAGRASILALVDVVPRLAASLAGAVAVRLTHLTILFPVAVAVLPSAVVVVYFLRERGEGDTTLGGVGAWIRASLAVSGAEVIAGLYSIGASALVAVSGTALTVSQFNTGYRFTTACAMSIAALSNSLVSWVTAATGASFVGRARASFALHTGLGVIGFLLLWTLGPWLGRALFGTAIAASRPEMLAMGVFFLLWSVETVTSRHVLAARGATRTLLTTTLAGSVVGVCLLILSSRHGAAAAAWALVAAMGLTVALQCLRTYRILRAETRGVDSDGGSPNPDGRHDPATDAVYRFP